MSDELYHYGKKGMKWGVRNARASVGRFRSRQVRSPDAQYLHEMKKRRMHTMSNAELKKANDRMQLEQNYSNLRRNQREIYSGKSYLAEAFAVGTLAVGIYGLTLSPLGKAGASWIKSKHS